MTISNASSRFSYTSNNVTVNFSFPAALAAQSDLRVLLHNNTSGVDANQTLNTAYNLSGSTDAAGVYTAGVTVTFAAAPATGQSVVIFRDPPLTQSLSLVENDPLPAKQLEKSYDLGVMIAQRLSDRMNRAITFPDGDVNITTQLPNLAVRAGRYLGFDAATGDLTVANGTGNSTDATMVNYTDGIAPSYLKTVSDVINGDQVSVFRFIPRTLHAAIQNRTSAVEVGSYFNEAIHALMNSNNSGGLYVPRGTYLHNSNNTYGNTAGEVGQPVVIRGEGPYSTIYASGAGVTPITIKGTNPLVDANRHIGRVLIERLAFAGPAGFAAGGTGTALFLNGVQGITLDKVYMQGWENAVKAAQVDLLTIRDAWLQYNSNGVYNYEDAAAFSYPGGTLNSFRAVDSHILHNSIHGIYVWGGTSHNIERNNFVANNMSVAVAMPVGINAVAVGTHIRGNYFENSSLRDIGIGGAGIARAGSIWDNTSLVANGTTAIRLFNVSNAGGRGSVGGNQMSAISGTFTTISQAGSAETWDYEGRNGSSYEAGSYVSFSKTLIGAGNSTNIAAVSTSSQSLTGEISIEARTVGLGNGTTRLYPLSIIGGGTAATQTPLSNESFAGGAAPFNFTEIGAKGTHNVLQISNAHSATCNYTISLHIKQLTGTLTLL